MTRWQDKGFEVLDEGPHFDMIDVWKEELRDSIEDMVLVEFSYNDLHRIVEPYEVGETKDGNFLLRGYQIDGESLGNRVQGWKLFRLDYISALQDLVEEFSPRGDYFILPPFWTGSPIYAIEGVVEVGVLPARKPEEAEPTPAEIEESADWLSAHMSKEPTLVVNPATGVEHMAYTVEVSGVPFYFDSEDDAAIAVVEALRNVKKIPGVLLQYFDAIQLVDEEAPGKPDVIANIRTGIMTIFNSNVVDYGMVAHEAAHEFANDRWGFAAPPENSDYKAAIKSGEPAVSEYAKVSPGEDFSESVRLYTTDPGRLKKIAPRRYKVIDTMIKDEKYGG